MKKFLVLVLSLPVVLYAQVKSPKEFLGYELGSKWTPHFKIVNYFNHVAKEAYQQVKLEKYGETYEGRPLYLAFVSTPDNIARLEQIRENNLRLAGVLTDKPGDVNGPAIVWLSYNVHGNETSSSEAAMKVLYELLKPSEFFNAGEWLKNTVVIIDPCINPDGRDRYVNWYNSVVGSIPNPNPDSREQHEPWPGGRTNHYNFDLNRDWAWQTQTESQSRIKVYNRWMPHIHSDYHEQGYNDLYYFAPAAEPYHEVITPWQRELQKMIGKNNAAYFDKNGWLFFTKEIFDLFYPSYGDTYPTYNGSIGMTFEQAGLGRGLAITKADGEVLTLYDRIARHFTTSLSTIEIASKNAGKITKEFQKFFTDSRANAPYQTYVLESQDAARIKAVKELLDRNGIINEANIVSVSPFTGYNYITGKTEMVQPLGSTIVINSNQPKAALIKVLMEPVSKLADSVTYDITSWSLPYVYGVNGYAVKGSVSFKKNEIREVDPVMDPNPYGFAVQASAANGKLISSLLKNNIKVRYAENAFENNGKFQPGSLIILTGDNKGRIEEIRNLAGMAGAELRELRTGMVAKGYDFGSSKFHFIKKPNVALVTGKGADANAAGEVWHLFEQQLEYPIHLYNADDIDADVLKKTDVLIFPNGNFKMLGDKDASADLKTWVRQGGKIIAFENAASQLAGGDWGIKVKKADEEKKEGGSYADLKKYENRERDGVSSFIPGAIYKTELDNTHPLAFGYPNYYYTLKMNGDVFEFMKDGWNVAVVKKDKQVAGFVGSKLQSKIQDGTVIGDIETGRGHVIFFADNPIFRSFWENGKQLLENAVFLVGN